MRRADRRASASSSGIPPATPASTAQNVQAPTGSGLNRVARSNMSGTRESAERGSPRWNPSAMSPLPGRLPVTLALAGCGDAPTAAGLVDCFDLAGFEAAEPKPREESVLAFHARRKGYDVEPVKVSKSGMLTPYAFLVFFESSTKAREAMEELGATSFGEVPQQQRGPAVIGYGDKENRKGVQATIEDCL